jgi:putative oxidoreductase
MARFMKRFEGPVYAGLRILAGLLFMQHGLQKIFGMFGGAPAQLPEPARWAGGAIELVGGALIALGLSTRWAAFVCSGMMAVAYFMAHAPQDLFPILNHGELAILYCWIFLLIAARGSGAFSLDQLLGRRS